jgi:lysyl endopeptidase
MRRRWQWIPGLWLYSALVAAAPVPISLPAPDVEAVLEADRRPADVPRPYRFAMTQPDFHLQLLGADGRIGAIGADSQHETLADGRHRHLWALHSRDALNLNFHFAPYRMPAGGSLRILDQTGQPLLGPYTEAHNAGGALWTPLVATDTVQIELILPAGSEDGEITLAGLQHGFRSLGDKQDTVTAKSGSCNIDVVCPAGDDWRQQIRSVARYTISGQFLCSGQMLNNVRRDLSPYFLTASHCLSTTAEAQTVVLYWNYETSVCGGTPNGSLRQTSLGAVVAASSGTGTDVGSDFTLLRLNEVPPLSYGVYYAGWDNRDIAPFGVTGIHHPAGDEKRISFSFRQTEITAYAASVDSLASQLARTHLRVPRWDQGTTEGGSSGSAIFNASKRVVGQLSGGLASCDNPTGADWYGRMYSNWFDLQSPSTSVAPWLDPDGTGVATLDGVDTVDFNAPSPSSSQLPRSGGGSGAGLLWLLLAAALRQAWIGYLRSNPRSWW